MRTHIIFINGLKDVVKRFIDDRQPDVILFPEIEIPFFAQAKVDIHDWIQEIAEEDVDFATGDINYQHSDVLKSDQPSIHPAVFHRSLLKSLTDAYN
jgi:hypothetical protein